jgi:tetratricopeptide (TPR) repeat protein
LLRARRDTAAMRLTVGMIRALFVLLILAAPLSARAADYVDNAALDELFTELRTAHDAGSANDIVVQIWGIWFHPDVPELADRMGLASLAMSNQDPVSALRLLNGIVRDYPDYSEGWNQRATLHYMMNDFDASLSDIERVLALEPRHFGALSGRVMIYLQQGKRAEALKDMIAALAIDPWLEGRKLFPELSQNTTNV